MLSYDDMPDDNADLAKIEFQFPCLSDNSPDGCPVPLSEVVDYLRLESPDGDDVTEERLEFVRTAQVGDHEYRLWRFVESDGDECFVTVAREPDGTIVTGYNTSEADVDDQGNTIAPFTPEQYMLGDFPGVF